MNLFLQDIRKQEQSESNILTDRQINDRFAPNSTVATEMLVADWEKLGDL